MKSSLATRARPARARTRPPSRAPRRTPRRRSGPDDQQGLRVRHAGRCRRRASHHARRSRSRGCRRHRVDEPHAVSHRRRRRAMGASHGQLPLVDAMYRDGFTCSLSGMIMGETAEVLARQYGITREAVGCITRSRRSAAPAPPSRPGTSPRDRAGHRDRCKGTPRRSPPTSTRGPTRPSSSCASCRRFSATSRVTPASSPPVHRRGSPTAAPRWC